MRGCTGPSLLRQGGHPPDDLATPRGVARRVVEELRRLDADRREASLDLRRDRRGRVVEGADGAGGGEAPPRAAAELEPVDVAAGVRERPAEALDVLVARRAERIPAVSVPDDAAQAALGEAGRAEPQPHAVGAPRLRLDPDVVEAVMVSVE